MASAGYELPLLLFAAFRAIIDELHAELAKRGHPDVRPAYGFAMQAVGVHGASASAVGRHLGVTKQAAGKTIDRLFELGYVERFDDPEDARRKLVKLTPRGVDSLRQSAEIFDEIRVRWVAQFGAERVDALEDMLRAANPRAGFPVDVPGWFG